MEEQKELAIRPADEDAPTAVDAEALIAKAIEKNLPVETMEKLLAMRRELKAEWARDEYYRELAAFQAECPIIRKTKSVYDKQGKLRYAYATLDEILSQTKALLQKHGFSYTIQTEQKPEAVKAICIVHHVAGHSESSEFEIPIDQGSYMNAAQKVASALTYAKRYSFGNAFGVLSGDEDDDAQATGPPREEKAAPPKQDLPKPTSTQADIDAAHEAIDAAFNDGIIDKDQWTEGKTWIGKYQDNKKALDTMRKHLADERERQEGILAANSGGFDDSDKEAVDAALEGANEPAK